MPESLHETFKSRPLVKTETKTKAERNAMGEETRLKTRLGCPRGRHALFVLLSHFHGVRPLLCWGYVRHGRVLPLGCRLILHLLFLDQRRHVSVGCDRDTSQQSREQGEPTLVYSSDLSLVPRSSLPISTPCLISSLLW